MFLKHTKFKLELGYCIIFNPEPIQLEEFKLKHNWPNLHNETSFNYYKDHSYYFPLSSIINNKLTDKQFLSWTVKIIYFSYHFLHHFSFTI